MNKEEIIELMISASKWGSWAWDIKERERAGTVFIGDFKKWQRETMEEIYEEKLLSLNE